MNTPEIWEASLVFSRKLSRSLQLIVLIVALVLLLVGDLGGHVTKH